LKQPTIQSPLKCVDGQCAESTNCEKITRTVISKIATSPGVVESLKDIETSLETLSKELLDASRIMPDTKNKEENQATMLESLERSNLREFFKIAKGRQSTNN